MRSETPVADLQTKTVDVRETYTAVESLLIEVCAVEQALENLWLLINAQPLTVDATPTDTCRLRDAVGRLIRYLSDSGSHSLKTAVDDWQAALNLAHKRYRISNAGDLP